MKKTDSKQEADDLLRARQLRKDRRRKDHFVDYYTCSLGYGRKKGRRIRTLNWVSGKEEPEEIPDESEMIDKAIEEEAKIELEEKVDNALDKLDGLEKEFVRYFYYDCLSYNQISKIMHKTKDRLERIHRTALEKLKFSLKDFASQRYRIKIPEETGCLICSHPQRRKLEEVIKTKKKEDTWKKILRTFREDFKLEIKAPQILINHQKKHMPVV